MLKKKVKAKKKTDRTAKAKKVVEKKVRVVEKSVETVDIASQSPIEKAMLIEVERQLASNISHDGLTREQREKKLWEQGRLAKGLPIK